MKWIDRVMCWEDKEHGGEGVHVWCHTKKIVQDVKSMNISCCFLYSRCFYVSCSFFFLFLSPLFFLPWKRKLIVDAQACGTHSISYNFLKHTLVWIRSVEPSMKILLSFFTSYFTCFYLTLVFISLFFFNIL